MNASQSLFAAAAFLMSIFIVALAPRLIFGPTTADRLVALSAVNTLASCVMLLLSAVYDSVVMVDAAIVYMVFAFISTIYFVRRLEGGL